MSSKLKMRNNIKMIDIPVNVVNTNLNFENISQELLLVIFVSYSIEWRFQWKITIKIPIPMMHKNNPKPLRMML